MFFLFLTVCLKKVIRFFSGKFKSVLANFKGASRVIQKFCYTLKQVICFKDIYWKFQGCLQIVSKMFQGCLKKMFKVFQSCMLHVTHRSYPSRRRVCFLGGGVLQKQCFMTNNLIFCMSDCPVRSSVIKCVFLPPVLCVFDREFWSNSYQTIFFLSGKEISKVPPYIFRKPSL